MTLFDSILLYCDFTETITLKNWISETCSVINHAACLNVGKSEKGFIVNNDIPHIKAVWYVSISEVSDSIVPHDRIIDHNNREWIVCEAVPINTLDVFRCRCIHECLPYGNDDMISIYRRVLLTDNIQTDHGFTLVKNNVIAVPKSVVSETKTVYSVPASKVVETIVLYVKSSVSVETADLIKDKNDVWYEVISVINPDGLSDWGLVKAKRVTGNHNEWSLP